MAEQAIFKSQTFGGFNKDEVLKYIDKMNSEHTQEHEQAEKEISAFKAEAEEKGSKLEELQKKYDEIMEAYEELRQHYLMLKEHDDNVTAENEKLSARLEVTEKELAIEKELNSQLEDKLEEQAQRAEEQAANEKKLLAAIDDASDSTKLMLASAKNGAQSLIADAQSSADGINAEIDAFGEELEKVKSFMQDSLSVLVQRLEYIGGVAESAKLSSESRNIKSGLIQEEYEKLVSETETKATALKKRFFR